ncbi:hypothetical protein DUI87_18336 [Hirundo rustica rustica]|uniref:C2H2-type domain-containing protein n=1 Tax=Hirundo rustica rustica TaxID=333673 RepID=A0A3M0JVU8_HIRRU|nr:hypothetical protein DUI87_18336 [Hirundo rustica rustica]
MTGIAAASFFSNACRFGGCGLHFPTLAELIEHIEDNHIVLRLKVSHKADRDLSFFLCLLEWLWMRPIAVLYPHGWQGLFLLYVGRSTKELDSENLKKHQDGIDIEEDIYQFKGKIKWDFEAKLVTSLWTKRLESDCG